MRRVFARLQHFTPVKLPALSPSMTKGTIQEWKVKVGDEVTDGTLWCVIGTDKAGLDFTERVREGWVAKLYAQNGDELPVGKVIALLVDEKQHIPLADTYKVVEDVAAPQEQAAAAAPSPPPSATPKRLYGNSLDDAIKASGPAVALLASKLDRAAIAAVTPSGKGGRFTKSDLADLRPAAPAPAASASLPPAASAPSPRPEAPSPVQAAKPPGGVKATPVSDFSVSDTPLLKKLFRQK
jgi:pyruvate dehydrogenase E2 component (dihydrolipoamide acetyltransferase)